MSKPYLNPGLPTPVATELDQAYWEGLRAERLMLQRCTLAIVFNGDRNGSAIVA